MRSRNLYPDNLYVARRWNFGTTVRWQLFSIKASYQGYNKGTPMSGENGLNFAQLNMYTLYTPTWLEAYNNFAPEETEGEFAGGRSYYNDLVWLPKANSWHMVMGHLDYDVAAARPRLRHGEYILEQIADDSLVPPVTIPSYNEKDIQQFEKVTKQLHELVTSQDYNIAFS